MGIRLARHPSLRNAVNTIARALEKEGLITVESSRAEFSSSDGFKRTIAPHERTCLVNAVLLQGVFAEAPALEQYRDLIIRDYRDSKAVKALLDDWR